MVVPPLEVLNNATIELNGKNFSALYPSVDPGYYSNPKDLKFYYNITDFTPRKLKM